jgi:hypothetical protein
MDKLLWAVQAGDQIGDSEDDQPCGDHFIDKDLECHEGDAHRPTPGNNPYWQGERKGPEDKSKTPDKGGSKNQPGHERDRDEHTPQNRERMERLLDNGHTPESLGRDQVNHFADLMEEAYQRPLDDKDVHTLVDMVNQKMGESFSQDPSQKGIHDPTAPKGFKGPKGREMSRPDSYHKQTTDDAYTPGPEGGPEEGGLYDHYKNILKDRIGDGGGESAPEPKKEEGPSQEMTDEQEKWGGPGYQGEDAPESKPEKGEPGDYEFQERQVDEWDPGQSADESKPYRQKERRRQTQKDYKRKKDAAKQDKHAQQASLAPQLTWGKIVQDRVEDDKEQRRERGPAADLQDPEDVTEARPCGDGEDPKRGKCNPNLTTPSVQGPESDDPRMFKGKPQEGIGLQPSADPSRQVRMARHVNYLTQDNGLDPQKTTNLMQKMMGGATPQPQPDGSNLVGQRAASPQEAKQKNDDYKDTLTKSGWDNRSDMGGTSTWTKGKVAVVLKSTPEGNQMKVKGPSAPAAPKKKGIFR